MIIYLLKFSACLFVFWLAYVLFLENQNRHNFKRFYLLLSVAVALIIPFLSITYYVDPVIELSSFEAMPANTTQILLAEAPNAVTHNEEAPNYTPIILWSLYSIGTLLFLLRFSVNLFKLRKRIATNEQINQPPFVYVLVSTFIIPHSFFKYLFFNKKAYKNATIPEAIIIHEQTHAKQWHSLDILFVELLQIVLWFHPLVYLLKHHIKLNHEFLADQAVLQQGKDAKNYFDLLLRYSSSSQQSQLASTINYSSFKKRFTVMTTSTSKTKKWVSSLLLIPIAVLLFYSFSNKKYEELPLESSEAMKASAAAISQENHQEATASEAKIQEYKDFIKEYQETKVIFGHKYDRAVIIYDQLMSDEQRASVKKYPPRLIPKPNLSKTRPEPPTKAQFESFKDAKTYAIWIDGKHVSNSVLNNYNASDFVHHRGSSVFKNARSEKFPQPFQYSLYTKDGFKNTYSLSQLKKYNEALRQYSNALSTFLEGDQTDNSELKILYAQANSIYKTFSQDDINEHHIKTIPPFPTNKKAGNSNWKDVKYFLSKDSSSTLANVNQDSTRVSEEQLARYNKWAKALNEVSINNRIIKLKEFTYYENMYNAMSEEQRKSAQPLPIAPPPPPPGYKTKKAGFNKIQKTNTIEPVNIDVKKDSSLVLNGKPVKRSNIVSEILKVNAHLSKKAQLEYVMVSFIAPSDMYSSYISKIQAELRPKIASSVVAFEYGVKNSNRTLKHWGMYNDLSLNQAKARKDSIYNGDFTKTNDNKKPKKDSPLGISELKIESVEFIPDEEVNKSGSDNSKKEIYIYF